MVKNTDRAQKTVKKARKLLNPLANLKCIPEGKIGTSDGEFLTLTCPWSCHLSKENSDWAFDLFRRNMRELYMASQWGYDEHSKRQELEATTARYLILRNAKGAAVAYVHFRFVVENAYPVLYCYEIQLESEYQHRNLGTQLLSVLEMMALGTGMDKLMATVFTYNTQSLAFFRKFGFDVDEMSPEERCELDYLILSKPCSKAKKEALKSLNV